MKKTSLWFCCIFITLFFCVGCQKEIVTFKVARVQQFGGLTAAENLKRTQNSYQEAITKANETLEAERMSYRIEGHLISESDRESLDLSAYDLVIYPYQRVGIAYIEEQFVDILPELESGALQPLYESMPPMYWESIKNNGSIYNIVRANFKHLHAAMVLWPGQTEGESLYEEVTGEKPEALSFLNWSEWEDTFPSIYEQNDEQPFLLAMDGLGGNYEPGVCIYSFPYEFRMITPYLGISLHEENAKVECVYASEYAKEVKDWWIRQFEAGYGISLETLGTQKVMMHVSSSEIVYPFTKSLADGMVLLPFSEDMPIYAKEAGADQTYVLIPKTAPHLQELYQFLNELATHENLAQGIVDEYYLPLCPSMLWLGEQVEMFRWQGSMEATKAAVEQLFEQAYTASYSDFVFDETPVKEQYQAVEALFEGFNTPGGIAWEKETDPYRCASLEEWSSNWDANVAMLLEQMYDAGLQDIIDEANRQLGLE